MKKKDNFFTLHSQIEDRKSFHFFVRFSILIKKNISCITSVQSSESFDTKVLTSQSTKWARVM